MAKEVKTFPSVFSVDVEDGISLVMRDYFNKSISQTNRCKRTTKQILELLNQKDIKATFFVLGIFGKKFPDVVKEIVAKGHELAVHGHNHLKFYQMTPKLALQELMEAKDTLEQISGLKVHGHRAPAFSITKNTPWAFDILIEAGFDYDSSIIPIKSKYKGWHNFPKGITNVKTPNGSIKEFPISVIEYFGQNFPFSGGSYLRLLPASVVSNSLKKVIKEKPSVIYVHPYEFDIVKYPDFYFEELKKMDFKTQLKLRSNFLNRKKSIGKLSMLFDKYEFSKMSDVIENFSDNNETYIIE